ncbi:MAG TPA: 3-isopropylmalate dehydratase small subunit [Firmicutes bacterium]|nr:3-isopropylmalate dehydratase small subunit [Bacillota bacterium]HHY98708.1 3-isopropylmalate dehydratase small subunit [Bacillota bacterium]
MLSGTAHKFGDNINTDYIISGKYKFKTLDMDDLAKHIMEDLIPDFYQRIKPGDFLVAGRNFGCGSSREQAPLVIKHAHIAGVIAISFARIFYRNAINMGLPLLECDTTSIQDGDQLQVDMENGIIRDITTGKELRTNPLPKVMLDIMSTGGLVNYMKKYGKFTISA